MTKSKIRTIIYDFLFEEIIDNDLEMNILKIIRDSKCIWLVYKEHSQGLKTTFNHIVKALDRIGFKYLHAYYEDISKKLNNNSIYISEQCKEFEVFCYYDSEYKISTFTIKINRWLK